MIRNEQEFADRCLETLGAPVIKVNVDPVHVTGAIDDALQMFWDFHRDGSSRHFYAYIPTAEDVASGDLPAPTDIDSITEVVSTDRIGGIGAWHTPSWQAAHTIMTGGGTHARVSLVDYTMLKQRISDINDVLGDVYPFTYKRYQRKIECMFPLNTTNEVVFECYRNTDPRQEGMEEAWNDKWLRQYATALIKKRWGDILIVAQGISIAGGITLDGTQILSEAKDEIDKLETELRTMHSDPIDFSMA